jgi:hypothetical protein
MDLRLFVISSWITVHFGKNPINGRKPPSDKSVMNNKNLVAILLLTVIGWFTTEMRDQFSRPNSTLTLSTHLHLRLPSGLFSSGSSTNNIYELLFSPMRATCPIHLILLGLIILIILGKEYKSWNFSLCSFPHLSVTSSLFWANILLILLFSKALSLIDWVYVPL